MTDPSAREVSRRLLSFEAVLDDRLELLTQETVALRFLLDATTALSSALDYRDALRRLATIAVPALGDICLIDMAVDGIIERQAWAVADPADAELARELSEVHPPNPFSSHPVAMAIREGKSALVRHVTDEHLWEMATTPRHHDVFVALGYASYVCVPLVARGRTLGALMLVSKDRPFVEDDLTLAEELAVRASLAMDNVRLLTERTHVARALQAALLPPTLPSIPGLDLAARYRAAGEGNEVGGDLYDVFTAGEGRWGAAVGDVCGTGPEAAAMTGLVRHALHAAAFQEGATPATMLETADALVRERDTGWERFCSACCVLIDPGPPVEVLVASAGHPPPILLRPGAEPEELAAQSTLLGLGGADERATTSARLAPGDSVLLYTDGVIEARDARGGFFGDEALGEALRRLVGRPADEIAQGVLDAVEDFAGGALHDDLAILVIAVRPER